MAQGFFVVTPIDGDSAIEFAVKADADGTPPEDQAALIQDVERTVRILRLLFAGRDVEFKRYFEPLLSLAQGGLVGPQANPSIAARALTELKSEVLEREAGRVKNRYMAKLGAAAAWLGVPELLVAVTSRAAATFPQLNSRHGIVDPNTLSNFALLLVACTAGVWVSFGARKAQLTFEDLSIPEQDYLYPAMRLAFASVLTAALALLFHAGAIEVKLGAVTSRNAFSDPVAALLIGFLSGFSEQALSKTVAAQATRLLATNSP